MSEQENQNTALTTRPNAVIGVNMKELSEVAALIFNSKVFGDLQTKEAAAIKIIAGMEHGFTPFQAMSMFDFIQGSPKLNAHGKATLINSSGDFRLKIKELTNANCVIEVLRKENGEWKTTDTSTFSWEDAVTAELTTGKNAHSWKKYPRNMLFARCVSNIWRWTTAELNTRKISPEQISEFSAPELEAEGADQPRANAEEKDYIDAEIIETEAGEVVDTATGEVVDEQNPFKPETTEVDEERAAIEAEPATEPAALDEAAIIELRTKVTDAFNSTSGESRGRAVKLMGKKMIRQMDVNEMNAFLEAFPLM